MRREPVVEQQVALAVRERVRNLLGGVDAALARHPHEVMRTGAVLAPRGESPPLHIHHDEDEVFHILEGELRFRVGDDELRAGPGETLLAPKRVPHTHRVESECGGWLVTTTRGDFERFVRSFSRPAERDELPEPAGPPTPTSRRRWPPPAARTTSSWSTHR
jgi:mannose-6-phosphate isomerase-like protein (cupin superfamily)